MSRDVPIKTLLPDTGEMVYPLLQHIGNPSVPVVRRGDYVRTGQLIARADRDPSAKGERLTAHCSPVLLSQMTESFWKSAIRRTGNCRF